MIRASIGAAAAAACIALMAPAPAQARIADPGLSTAMPAAAQDAHYRRYRHSHRYYGYRRHRHCWNERVRVRVPGGYFVWRAHRRCGWRRW